MQFLESVCDSGGAEVGVLCRYEDGKYKQKKNTFTDLIAAAEHLINQTYTERSRLCIQVSNLNCCFLKAGQATYASGREPLLLHVEMAYQQQKTPLVHAGPVCWGPYNGGCHQHGESWLQIWPRHLTFHSSKNVQAANANETLNWCLLAAET